MTTTHIALSVAGGTIDITGGLLVASTEWVPRWRRQRERARDAFRALELRLGILKPVSNSISMPVEAGGINISGSLVEAHTPGGSIERKVAFLIEEANRAGQRLGQLERRMEEVPGRITAETERVRAELGTMFSEQLAASREMYIRWRLFGILLLALGGVVQAAANLVP